MNMNVGVPNSAPSYHKMTVEEYKERTFVPTKANLEKRRLERERAALKQQSMCFYNAARTPTDHDAGHENSTSVTSEEPFSTTMLGSPEQSANLYSQARPEVRRLSGNFNAPTHVEVERHKESKGLRNLKGMVKGWVKRSPPPTIA
jgi:hypothetical protein